MHVFQIFLQHLLITFYLFSHSSEQTLTIIFHDPSIKLFQDLLAIILTNLFIDIFTEMCT